MVKAIVGGNWGDEGKGKMTDLLAADSEIVVRYQGGADAGHTIVNDKGTFALHLLPSGVCYEHVTNVIGHGVALDLDRFFAEYDALLARGIAPRLLVSDRARLMMPYHASFDAFEAQRLGALRSDSTDAGIAPFCSDKCLGLGFQVCELFAPERLWERLVPICAYKSLLLQSVDHRSALDPRAIYDHLLGFAERLRPMVADTAKFLNRAIADGRTVLMEGQFGALRDVDHGVDPFTVPSSPLAGFASVGAGISPCAISNVITVVKAYSSCVGAGAFVCELDGEPARLLREAGREYGVTTGRPRRVGWLDLVATRYGCMVQGTTDVALTLVDVLSYLDKIPVVTGYKLDGEIIADFPCTPSLDRCTPVFEVLDGWKRDILGIDEWEKLPKNCRRYIEYVEKALGYPITYVSTGPAREHIIYR